MPLSLPRDLCALAGWAAVVCLLGEGDLRGCCLCGEGPVEDAGSESFLYMACVRCWRGTLLLMTSNPRDSLLWEEGERDVEEA